MRPSTFDPERQSVVCPPYPVQSEHSTPSLVEHERQRVFLVGYRRHAAMGFWRQVRRLGPICRRAGNVPTQARRLRSADLRERACPDECVASQHGRSQDARVLVRTAGPSRRDLRPHPVPSRATSSSSLRRRCTETALASVSINQADSDAGRQRGRYLGQTRGSPTYSRMDSSRAYSERLAQPIPWKIGRTNASMTDIGA